MPRMNGKELSEQLAAYRPSMNCLYISGYTAYVIEHQGILEEGAIFVPKPFDPLILAAKAREALDRSDA